jgi:hypothetical protein
MNGQVCCQNLDEAKQANLFSKFDLAQAFVREATLRLLNVEAISTVETVQRARHAGLRNHRRFHRSRS